MHESTPGSPELLRLLFQLSRVYPTFEQDELRDEQRRVLDDALGACATAIDAAADQAVRNRLNDTAFDVFFDREPVGGDDDDDA